MKQSGDNLIDRAHSQAMSALGNMIWGLFSKYWILLCGAMLLIVSLESNVDIFKIIYMGLFLFIINIFLVSKIIGRIHKNEQLLDWPFTRLLLESLYIKTSNYLQVKGHGLWTEQLLISS